MLTKLLLVNLLILFCLFTPNQSSSSQFKWDRSKAILKSLKDLDILTTYILIRGHFVIGPGTDLRLDKEALEKLLIHTYKLYERHLQVGGPIMYPPLEDRDLRCEYLPTKVKPLCRAVSERCLLPETMINMLPYSVKYIHQAITRLCPLILFHQSRYFCKSLDEKPTKDPPILVEPASEKVWAFSFLFVTLSIVVSMGGLILLPFLNRTSRRIILTLFEGLAVGGLAGSAILHLFPQAFGIEDQDYRKYFTKTLLIFAGIYFFYMVERILNLLQPKTGRNRRRRGSSFREEQLQHINSQSLAQASAIITPMLSGANNGDENMADEGPIAVRESEILDAIRIAIFPTPKDQREGVSRKKQMKKKLASIRDPTSMVFSRTRAVAWMIVLGDASLNFIDGLSIGAAFDRNILAGISIAVAVMLEEVPHRLGTFAVLIRAGMDMKQAFFWIFISACSLYPGLVLGIFLGDAAEEENPFIFALAAGMFLYIALVDVMKEMNRSMENASRKGVTSSLQILGLQNLGVFLAIICLSALALYEKELDFEAVELRELRKNALQ